MSLPEQPNASARRIRPGARHNPLLTMTASSSVARSSGICPWAGPDGSTRLELNLDGRAASRLWIIPFTLRIGAAEVRMDGIGGVGTEPEYQKRGLARQLLDDAIERMGAGDAALAMLYGIPDFYHRFAFATAGRDHFITLNRSGPTGLPA